MEIQNTSQLLSSAVNTAGRSPSAIATEADDYSVIRQAEALAHERSRITPADVAPLSSTMQSLLGKIAEQKRLAEEADRRGDSRLSRDYRQPFYLKFPQELLNECGVPSRYRVATFDTSQIPIEHRADYRTKVNRLCELTQGPSIVPVLGERGTGKTWMSCALVMESCRRSREAIYCDVTDFFLQIKATYGPESKLDQTAVEKKYSRCPLLVLDEMHERGDTDWEDRMLTRLINKRYSAELTTVLISNQKEQQFVERIGQSIADRINDGGGVILCEWESLRGQIGEAQ